MTEGIFESIFDATYDGLVEEIPERVLLNIKPSEGWNDHNSGICLYVFDGNMWQPHRGGWAPQRKMGKWEWKPDPSILFSAVDWDQGAPEYVIPVGDRWFASYWEEAKEKGKPACFSMAKINDGWRPFPYVPAGLDKSARTSWKGYSYEQQDSGLFKLVETYPGSTEVYYKDNIVAEINEPLVQSLEIRGIPNDVIVRPRVCPTCNNTKFVSGFTGMMQIVCPDCRSR